MPSPSPLAPGRRRRTRAGARPHHRLGHPDEALAADLDRALELNPSYACARERRDAVVRDRDG
ncbi:tetratricopeptide repeat protein [Streptomyces griseoincarnatus]